MQQQANSEEPSMETHARHVNFELGVIKFYVYCVLFEYELENGDVGVLQVFTYVRSGCSFQPIRHMVEFHRARKYVWKKPASSYPLPAPKKKDEERHQRDGEPFRFNRERRRDPGNYRCK
ncbi:hypothetical protein U1Q18_042188 [Sarracenia purpurea var. burkii]